MEDAKALTDNAIDAVPLEEVDYNVRYSLMLVGVISGRQRRIDQYKQLCYAVNVLHTLMCVIFTVNLLMCLILGWDDEDDAKLQVLIVKVAFILWYCEVTVGTITMFIKCHSSTGFQKLYLRLSAIEHRFQALSIQVATSSLKRRITAALSLTWIFWAVNIAIKIYDYATLHQQDPIFGEDFQRRTVGNYSSSLSKNSVQSIAATSTMVVLTHWIFTPSYYITLFMIIKALFAAYNDSLAQQVTKNRDRFLSKIERYRHLHLDLCGLIREVNRLFSVIAGLYMGFSVLILLLVFYIESYHQQIKSDTLIGIYFYWIIWELVMAFLFVIIGQILATEVCKMLIFQLKHLKLKVNHK